MNLLARVLFFISSYAPLGALYFLLYVGRNNLVALVSLGISVVSTLLIWLLLRSWKGDVESVCDEVLEYRKPGAEVMGYIASYLLPFLGFSLENVRNIAVLAVYLIILGYLYVTTDMMRVNPTLNIFLRYGVYEAKLREYGDRWLIARGNIRQGLRIPVVAAGRDVVIQKELKCPERTNK